MSRHCRRPTLARMCRQGVAKAAGLGVIATVLVLGGAGMAQVQHPADEPTDASVMGSPVARDVTRLMDRFDCSTVGYGDGVSPRSAIVRKPSGRLRVVTFDEGWAVYTAKGDAQLVAVCLRPVDR